MFWTIVWAVVIGNAITMFAVLAIKGVAIAIAKVLE